MPLDKMSGPEVFGNKAVSSTEEHVAYSDLWTPANLLGSASFSQFMPSKSFIETNLKKLFPGTLTQMTMMMWVKPLSGTHRPVVVRC